MLGLSSSRSCSRKQHRVTGETRTCNPLIYRQSLGHCSMLHWLKNMITHEDLNLDIKTKTFYFYLKSNGFISFSFQLIWQNEILYNLVKGKFLESSQQHIMATQPELLCQDIPNTTLLSISCVSLLPGNRKEKN